MTSTTSQTIGERQTNDVAVDPAEILSAQSTEGTLSPSAWVDMQNFQRGAAVAFTDNLSVNATLKVQLKQATDASGTSSKNLGSEQTVEITSGNAGTLVADAVVGDLDIANNFRYISAEVKLDPDSSTTANAGALAIRADGSYRP
jgi:hypothetical protein